VRAGCISAMIPTDSRFYPFFSSFSSLFFSSFFFLFFFFFFFFFFFLSSFSFLFGSIDDYLALGSIELCQQSSQFLEGRFRVLGEHCVLSCIKHTVTQHHLQLHGESRSKESSKAAIKGPFCFFLAWSPSDSEESLALVA